MKTTVYKEARISIYILALVMAVTLLFYIFASMFTSVGYKGFRKAKSANIVVDTDDVTIIIDAGHGGEDPGAVDNGLIEKELNLDVALFLNEIFLSNGYKTALTREEDILLYKQGEENRKKHFDVRNRVSFAGEFENAMFVSIHMNKFSAKYCRGLQTFYSENNPQSKLFADSIQENSRLLQTDNKRIVKSGNDTIYILENLNIPAVLVECGFLSNDEEAQKLSDKEYQKALAFTIYCGIVECMRNV